MSREPASDAPWVLLRGLARDARHWGDFAGRLAARDPAARVLTPDLPGNGARHRERSPARIAAMTEDLRGQLQASGTPPPYRVCALSLGAMLCVDWLNRYPQEIVQATLINTSLRGHARFTQRLRPPAWPRLLRAAMLRDAREAETVVLHLTSRRADPAVLADWAQWRRTHPVRAGNLLRQLLAAARFVPPPPPAAAQLRLLAGAGDQLVDPRSSAQLAAAWGCPLQLHPWAGHDLPLDDPDWVLDRLLDRLFWPRHPAPR